MNPVLLGDLVPAQEQSWHGLLELAERVPRHWCLVGGQMVFLLCRERGALAQRATTDADAVIDVRAHPGIHAEVTGALSDLGFVPSGESLEGHQHRWVRGSAHIDLMLPSGVGERAARRRGATGGTLPEAPGANGALARAERVEVVLNGMRGAVWRPRLLGAIAMKAAAFAQPGGQHRDRHLIDIAVLAALVEPSDVRGFEPSTNERKRIISAVGSLANDSARLATIPGARDGLERLRLAFG